MTSDNRGGPRKGRPEGPATTLDTRGDITPTVRPGVYARPLPLRRSGLPSECWWLRQQSWCEQHLERLASAWSRVYGRAA